MVACNSNDSISFHSCSHLYICWGTRRRLLFQPKPEYERSRRERSKSGSDESRHGCSGSLDSCSGYSNLNFWDCHSGMAVAHRTVLQLLLHKGTPNKRTVPGQFHRNRFYVRESDLHMCHSVRRIRGNFHPGKEHFLTFLWTSLTYIFRLSALDS